MRRALVQLTALTLLSGLAACGGEDSGGTDKVSVGVIPIVDVAPIYLGEKQGFFSEREIDLKLESGQGGAAIVPGVASGEFQFGFSNVTSLLLARSQDLPIKMVANGVASTGEDGKDFGAVVVGKDSDIKSAKDLSGRTVAVNTLNNIGDTTIRESIRADGGDPEKVEFTEFGFPDMPAQLESGNVDAAWVVEPFLSIVKKDGGTPVAWNYVDAAPDLTVATYFTSQQQISENPDLVKRFTEAIDESLRYAQDHPDEVRDILGDYTEIDEQIRADMTLPRWPTEINEDSVHRLAELGDEDGIFESTPDIDALLP